MVTERSFAALITLCCLRLGEGLFPLQPNHYKLTLFMDQYFTLPQLRYESSMRDQKYKTKKAYFSPASHK